MELFINIYLFIVGIVLGSFYNVVGLRIPLKESIVRPRSSCPSCKRELQVADLIPVFSYVFIRGKCRSCGVKISPLYPLVEFFTGVLFVFSFQMFGFSGETIVAFTLVSLLMIIFVSDIVYMIIPDKVLLFFTVLLIVERFVVPLNPWWDSAVGAVVGFGLLFLIAYFSKGGMGGGDIKLFFVIGLVLGWKLTLLAFFLATFIGALIGLIGMIGGRLKKRQQIPFGPFIVIGTLVSYFYGNNIIDWYLQIL